MSKCDHARALSFYNKYYHHISPASLENPSTTSYVVEKCIALLQICGSSIPKLRQIHAFSIRHGVPLTNLDMAKNLMYTIVSLAAPMPYAHRIFTQIQNPNVFAWNTLIRGYAESENPEPAIHLYRQLHAKSIEPDAHTFPFLLKAVAKVVDLRVGEQIHSVATRNGFESLVFVKNSLLHLYAACGQCESAYKVFELMPERDLVAWNSIINGFALNGKPNEALALYREMGLEGVEPDGFTMVSLLSACAELGALALGRRVHPNAVIWRTLLGACTIHGHLGLGEFARAQLLQLEPKHCGDYVLISNLYASERRWSDVHKVRRTMLSEGVRKTPGHSLVELGNSVHEFVMGDKTHPQTEATYAMLDYNGDGKLSFSEFSDLISAFGNQVAECKKEELFKAADKNGDGVVSMDELAELLAIQQEEEPLINCCPVCGEILDVSDRLNTVVHLSLCFDEGTGNQVMRGGFLTDKQASYGWMFKLSEWAHFSSYDVGLNSGSSASYVLVFDRKTKRLVEELIDGKIVLSMRAIYQSKIGLGLMDKGAKEILQSLSEKQGRKMDTLESAKDIPKFVEAFKDQINLAEVKHPMEHFKTFNEFFIRELKPGARPIAFMERDDIAVCAADCRLMAFRSVEESLRFWIKGRKFSINGLLGAETCSSSFTSGSLVIFRLAPQDYHRFHVPVSGTIEQFTDMPGSLYTVNPIAVNSKYCNVFTENKRVAFVAIGATMVGSITFLKKKGDYVKKGDEGAIRIDEDLLANSARSLETLVSVGMRLGAATKNQPQFDLGEMQLDAFLFLVCIRQISGYIDCI
ncbi:hypothetical protein Tsubulata_033282 [Turnera subulata]|uniref:EF-hand domain-containing protein n=1 Tax=Turnera subulata TaxID=218843 RepID=A0A9Q0IZW2_9ROSI|nr:hypothetical protein Tsubulata_033282 [Turnera subulata]